MSGIYKKVELFSNIAIIVVAILIGFVLIKRYFPPASQRPEAVKAVSIKPGTKLSFTGVDWEKGDKTLLMVLSTNCRYCTESAPFYQQLVQRKGGRNDVRIMAVLPQKPNEAQKYLSTHGISVDEVRQAVRGADYARSTPTLIVVDKSGSIVDSWVGKLPPEKETEVLKVFLGESQ